MTVDSTTFRTVLGQWPSGVCVVTTTAPHGAHGMTASSFSSVSLDPPLVSVCLGNHLPSRMRLETAGRFAISFLGKDQAQIGRRFAGQHPEVTDRFAGLDWTTTPNGVPALSDAVAWLDCVVAHTYPGGDHTIFVGGVTAAATPRVTSPLLFHSRTWGQVADPLPAAIHLSVDVAAGDPRGAGGADLGGAGAGGAGTGLTGGNFLAPALVTGADPARTVEEIFGPVAAVHEYASLDEAVVLANGTRHGLEGYVVGADEEAALAVARRVRAGEVKVNGSSVMSLHLFTPRPAWGLSGYSEEGTAETLRFFTNPRVVGVEGGFALHGRP